MGGKFLDLRRGRCRDDIQLLGDLMTVCIEWQVIDVVAKRILDLAANGSDSEDNIRGGFNMLARCRKAGAFTYRLSQGSRPKIESRRVEMGGRVRISK